jgi:hypothetical protein
MCFNVLPLDFAFAFAATPCLRSHKSYLVIRECSVVQYRTSYAPLPGLIGVLPLVDNILIGTYKVGPAWLLAQP